MDGWAGESSEAVLVPVSTGCHTAKSRLFELVALELQRAAVFADGAHHVLRHAFGDVRGDVQTHGDLGADEARQVSDHFLGDGTRVASDAGRV